MFLAYPWYIQQIKKKHVLFIKMFLIYYLGIGLKYLPHDTWTRIMDTFNMAKDSCCLKEQQPL